MKKLIAIMLAALLVFAFAGCGAKEDAEKEPETSAATEPQETQNNNVQTDDKQEEEEHDDPYYFAANGVEMRIMDEAEPVLAALGEPAQTFEADSCAFQGKDYFYYYDGYQLMVNDVDGVKRITSITMVDDTIKTPQGIGIGSKEEEIAPAFGADYTQATGMYVYRHETTTVQISVQNGTVSALVYAYAVEN